MFRKSISTVLILSVALAVLLGVGGIVAYVSGSSQAMSLKLYQQGMDQVAAFTGRALDVYRGEARSMVTTLAGQAALAEALDGRPDRAKARLADYMQAHKDRYWAIFLFDAKGVILAGYNANMEDLAGQPRGDRDYVKAVLGGQDFYASTEVFKAKSGSGDMLIYALAKAMRGQDGKVAGGVGVFPKWEVFTQTFIDPPRFGERGYPFMLDRKGRIIAHAVDKSLLLKDLSEHEFVRKALETKNGSFLYDWKGERKYLAFTQDPDTGWLVCMSAYVSEMTGTATDQRNMLLGIGALVILVLVIGIGAIVTRLVVRPVRDIQAFTSHVAGGDFKAALHVDFRFELARLADDIRTMVAELKHKLGFSQGLLDGMTISCVVADPAGKLLFVNQTVLDLLELPGHPQDYIGTGVAKFFYDDENRPTIIGKALAEGRPIRNVQAEITSRKGKPLFIQIDAAPMSDLDGKVIAGFAIFSDLTEIRAQQRRIEAQNAVIAQAAAQATSVSDQVASAAEQLSAQIEQSSRGTDLQRSRTGEAATAMEEMNATVMEVARSAGSAADLADRAKHKAQEGAGLVDNVVGTINTISSKAEELKTDMTELGRQAQGIGQIMNVIADIADQTNLLALNAAIEAARAGEAGRGFAVVADEVRKLAEKTMNATNEVGGYIKAVQDSARKNIQGTEDTTRAILASTEMANHSGQALREIVEMVEATADQVRGIATASEQQSAASEEINRTTDDINRIAAETADAMGQSAQAVSDLSRLAQELRRIIAEMKHQA